MIAPAATTVLAVFLVFCRVGTCMMVAPGYSRSNIPLQVRLFLALSVTLMLSPLLEATVRPALDGAAAPAILGLIWSELVIGLMIGLSARVFFAALETMATFIASGIGLNLAGTVDDGEHVPALVPLITVSATVLFFMTDQHWELLRGLLGSYRIWLPAVGVSAGDGLGQLVDHLSQAFTLALRVASPFVIYSIIVNLAIGLANKLTPSIPVYFISLPFVLFGGLLLLYLTSREMVLQFSIAFAAWLAG
ncbi:MAG TPA: flagellar biosynthesis protein FliR [Rhodopseudomonas sp.]|uniref:flagellar biosynthesis protein FliR n=1 Tax=Rhodopseudomonas sp. TaxID=1078 RepID=UPI002ED85C6A